MSLSAGTRLGPYEIQSAIGAGGMGEVYRATDTNLKRAVAIKVLPASVAGDPERLARFKREAQVLASLNHPNIAAIYGLEEADGIRALVLELVEGPTLADRIARGPVPLDEALPIARQLCEALEAAHDQGIIHRDLKPTNIKLRTDGAVKVLDFGLAKALEPISTPGGDATESPTITSPAMTRMGMILGTAAYMAPEQAKGRPADTRSDIWAFGCVLFEMLTGRRAFAGEDIGDTLAAVLRAEPDWSAVASAVPASIRRLLRRCLEKDRRHRLADIADARLEIEDAVRSPRGEGREPAAAGSSRAERVVLVSALAAAVLVAVGAVVWAMRPRAVENAPFVRLQLVPADTVTIASGGTPEISPDGRVVAFWGSGSDGARRVFIRALDTLETRPLVGTESTNNTVFWSPDSRQVAFQASHVLKKIDIVGGLSQSLCDLNPSTTIQGGSWNSEGVIIVGDGDGGLIRGLIRGLARGGPCEPVTRSQEEYHLFPVLLPDGRHVLFTRLMTDFTTDLVVGSLDAPADNQQLKTVLKTNYSTQYVSTSGGGVGHLLFVRDGTLFAQPFDPEALKLSGEAVPLAGHVGTLRRSAYFSASTNGVLVYRTSESNNHQLTWFDRQGHVVAEPGDPVTPRTVAVSRDGTQAAFVSSSADSGLMVMDLVRGTATRLGTADSARVLWSPDRQRVAFQRAGDLYQRLTNGTKDAELLLKVASPADWSGDGRFLLYRTVNATTQADLWALPLEGARTPFAVVQTAFSDTDGRFSPDSRWVAYISDELGRPEVHVRAFVPLSTHEASDSAGGRTVSKGGVSTLLGWRADGKELWYMTPDLKIMSVALTLGPTVQASEPTLLFQMPPDTTMASTDGTRFLLAVPSKASARVPFTVMLNWPAALRK